jgi:hypothetical protein
MQKSDFETFSKMIENGKWVRHELVYNQNFFRYRGNNPEFIAEVKRDEGLIPMFLFLMQSLKDPTYYFITDLPYTENGVRSKYNAETYKIVLKLDGTECFSIFPTRG